MEQQDIMDYVEYEARKIYAICDILFTIEPSGLERNTLAGLGVILKETITNILKRLKEYFIKGNK